MGRRWGRGEGGRVGAAGHDTTKRRDVSRAPRYRPPPRDTVVVVVLVFVFVFVFLFVFVFVLRCLPSSSFLVFSRRRSRRRRRRCRTRLLPVISVISRSPQRNSPKRKKVFRTTRGSTKRQRKRERGRGRLRSDREPARPAEDSIGLSTFRGIVDLSRRATRIARRRAACTRVVRTRVRRQVPATSRSCRHGAACVREYVLELPSSDYYEPPRVRPNDCPSRDHGRHMFVIRSVHEMYAVSS